MFQEHCKIPNFIKNHNPRKGTETSLQYRVNVSLVILKLKIIIPVRGRKQLKSRSSLIAVLIVIKNHNPHKGTETSCTNLLCFARHRRLKITIPVRGRKHCWGLPISLIFRLLRITISVRRRKLCHYAISVLHSVARLKIIILVRGRKRQIYWVISSNSILIKNHNPRKGTETIYKGCREL